MRYLSNLGRIFYGAAIVETGLHSIYYYDYPYWLMPPQHSPAPGLALVVFNFGALFVLFGACIIAKKWFRTCSILLGIILLLLFCFYFIPWGGLGYRRFGDWENAAKELAIASGAMIIAGSFRSKDGKLLPSYLGRLRSFGVILFSITIASFGIDHYLYANEVADYVPSWMPYPLFWTLTAGIALFIAGIAMIIKIKDRLTAILLGLMILSWFIILHIPRVITANAIDVGGESSSAFLALAYGGIAFVIAGDRQQPVSSGNENAAPPGL